MEIIVSILIYIGAIAGGNNANYNGNKNGIQKRIEIQNPHLVVFVSTCQTGTTYIKDKHKTYMLEHQHGSSNTCYIHIMGNGKNFEKAIANKGCILKLIGIDDLID